MTTRKKTAFITDMTFYMENPKESRDELLGLIAINIKILGKVVVYKINIYRSVAFL